MSLSKLKEYIREIIKDELEEASTSANVPGYQTPFAFSDPKKFHHPRWGDPQWAKIKKKFFFLKIDLNWPQNG